jgi:cytochrome P450
LIPTGVNVIPQIAAVLSDPDVFDRPAEFRPERFLMADMKTANKEAIENVCYPHIF